MVKTRRDLKSTECVSPAISASQSSRATSAGSLFLSEAPTLVSSISARSKNSVSTGPDINVVIVTPLASLSSLRIALENCL